MRPRPLRRLSRSLGAAAGWSLRLSLPAIAAALSGLLVLAIPLFLLGFSLPLLEGGQWSALFSWHWRPLAGQFGILPMLVGSLLLSTSAMLLAFPLALGLCAFVHGIGPQWAAPAPGPVLDLPRRRR